MLKLIIFNVYDLLKNQSYIDTWSVGHKKNSLALNGAKKVNMLLG